MLVPQRYHEEPTLVRFFRGLGGTLAGAATARFGAPLTTMIGAVIGLLLVVWVTPWIPRRTEVPQEG